LPTSTRPMCRAAMPGSMTPNLSLRRSKRGLCVPRLLLASRFLRQAPGARRTARSRRRYPRSPSRSCSRWIVYLRSNGPTAASHRKTASGRGRSTARPWWVELQVLMLKRRPGLSRHDDLAKAMHHMFKRWPVFEDGRVPDQQCRSPHPSAR
jgi:hypothetical protein